MAGGHYRFDRFTLDLDRMALLENGQPVDLRPKAFDTLLALVERAGRVVSKDELVGIVWPDVIVNDDALAQCIRDIRKALGEGGQKLVKTIPRRGYMFASAVEGGNEVPGSTPRAATPDQPTRRLSRAALAAMMLAGLALIAAVVALLPWSGETSDDPRAAFAREPRMTLAVLPFDAGGETGEMAWLGEGLADEVIMALSRFRDLAVIARTSSFGHRDADLVTIRDLLGADFVVQGSVRRVDDRLRLAVQLVDLSTGVNRWANRFERPYGDLPSVIDEVAADLATALADRARDAVAERTTGTAVLMAYELTMKARKALLSFEREQTYEALRFAEQALEADPGYAVAWDLVAQIHVQFFLQPYDNRRGDRATLEVAREAAAKAVALDPAYSTARSTLGGVVAWLGDYDGAMEMLRQALELNPNDAGALGTYADILDRAGEHEASLAAWDALEKVDPAGPMLRLALTSRAQMFTGDPEGALASANACEARAPRFQPCLVFLAIAAAAGGDEAAAREAGQRLLDVNPHFSVDDHMEIVRLRRPEDDALMRRHLRTAGLPD